MIDVRRGGTLPGDVLRWQMRHYPFDAILTAGTVSGGSTRILNGPRLQLQTALHVGADLASESCEAFNGTVYYNPHLFPARVDAWVVPTATTLLDRAEEVGLEYGSIGGAFLGAFPVGTPFVQLYATGDGFWFLRVARGDGTAFVTAQVPGAVSLWDGTPHHCTIDLVPGVFARGTINDPNGLFSVTIAGAGVPDGSFIPVRWAGVFVRTAVVNGQTQGLFATMNAYTPLVIHP